MARSLSIFFLLFATSLFAQDSLDVKRDAIGIRAGFGSHACIEASYRHTLGKLFQLEVDAGYQRDNSEDYQMYGLSVAMQVYFGLGWLEGFAGFGIQADQYKLSYSDVYKGGATSLFQFGVQKNITELLQLSWDARVSHPFTEQLDDVVWNTAIGARLRW